MDVRNRAVGKVRPVQRKRTGATNISEELSMHTISPITAFAVICSTALTGAVYVLFTSAVSGRRLRVMAGCILRCHLVAAQPSDLTASRRVLEAALNDVAAS